MGCPEVSNAHLFHLQARIRPLWANATLSKEPPTH
jgi:hypothetical protein